MPSACAADCDVSAFCRIALYKALGVGVSRTSQPPMASAYLPVYTIVSFYLRIVLFIFGIIVLATAASSLNLTGGGICYGFYCSGRYRIQYGEVRFAVFTGVFTFLFAGMLNIALSFFAKGLVLIIITVIDFLTGWFLFGSGIATARTIGSYSDKGTIAACCAFSFITMVIAATVFAFDLIELLALRQHGPGLVSSQREHQMTVAALKTSPFRSHSTVTYSKDQPANPNSTVLEHTESTAKPVGTEPNVDGYVDTTAPSGVPEEAQHEPKPAV